VSIEKRQAGICFPIFEKTAKTTTTTTTNCFSCASHQNAKQEIGQNLIRKWTSFSGFQFSLHSLEKLKDLLFLDELFIIVLCFENVVEDYKTKNQTIIKV
jgi:hypothetical protein